MLELLIEVGWDDCCWIPDRKGYKQLAYYWLVVLCYSFSPVLLVTHCIAAKTLLQQATCDEFIGIRQIHAAKPGGGLGMQIMLLCGFASYAVSRCKQCCGKAVFLNHSLSFKSPYIFWFACIHHCLFNVSGCKLCNGAKLLLMATLFPMMTAMGISPAATAVTSPAHFFLQPLVTWIAAEKSGLSLDVFAVQTVLPVSICAIIVLAITAFFWNKYLDKKKTTHNGRVDV